MNNDNQTKTPRNPLFISFNGYVSELLATNQRKLFEVWALADPVDEWERERGRRIDEMLTGRTSLD